MKKQKKIIIIITIVLIVISILAIYTIFKVNNKKKNDEVNAVTEEWNNQYSEVDKDNANYDSNSDVDKLKEQMRLSASSSMYEITEEYDGRKTLNIKTAILYKTAFAGIVKQEMPKIEEIDKIFQEKYPNENGIWVSERARDKILDVLEKNAQSKYEIDKNGYLKIMDKSKQNEQDKNLETVISGNRKIVVDINDYDYEVDNVSGEIVEYPFYQLGDLADVISDNNDKIIVISKSKINEIDSKEIIEMFAK